MDIRKVLAVTISMIFSALAPLYEAQASSERPLVSVVHEGIRFCESVYPYNGGIYISNFGSEELTQGAKRYGHTRRFDVCGHNSG